MESILDELGEGADAKTDKNGNLSIGTKRVFSDLRDPANRQEIKEFLADTVNRYVNTFRPRLGRLGAT